MIQPTFIMGPFIEFWKKKWNNPYKLSRMGKLFFYFTVASLKFPVGVVSDLFATPNIKCTLQYTYRKRYFNKLVRVRYVLFYRKKLNNFIHTNTQ